ncbi:MULTISPECIES: hypothetical protein [unclassified Agrococcus]|uniref:hypothetical protein n=1 Tax=unclassified Agrococcus TaxID=2615065 RepID=UPI00361E483D
MSDEHVEGTEHDRDREAEGVTTGGHQDRAAQWVRDDGAGTQDDPGPQDTADQWAGSGPERTEDAAEQWTGDRAEGGAQDTAPQWYEEGHGRGDAAER